jgi:transposase
MLNMHSSCKVYLCVGSTDMRKGINGLSILAQAILSEKFCNGALFVFRGKRADRIKILWWDGQGFCLFSENYPKIHTVAPDIEIIFSIVSSEGLYSLKNRSTLYFDNRALMPCRI